MKYEKVARLVAKQARPSRIKSGTVILGRNPKSTTCSKKISPKMPVFGTPKRCLLGALGATPWAQDQRDLPAVPLHSSRGERRHQRRFRLGQGDARVRRAQGTAIVATITGHAWWKCQC